ncbi:DUF885 domain-containing protein [Asaia astilbis]|uniref:DUF885 domain-containing protein n=1 Tax=Asaia astilbis TaxID=610244 RepID=UPI000471DA95|nr:DUF885 family protein [Asaia astilbis]
MLRQQKNRRDTGRKLALLMGASLVLLPLQAKADGIDSIVSDYDRFTAALDPVSAASRGDQDAAERWPDDTPQAEAARLKQRLAFRERLSHLDLSTLKGEALLSAQLMIWENDLAIEGQKFDPSRIPFTSDEGFYQEVGYAADNTPLRSEADARHWLVRMARIATYDAQQTENMRRGIATQFVQPRLIAEIALHAAKGQAELPERDNPALRPFDTLPKTMPAALRQSLRAEGERIVHEKIKPAEQALARFFETEYLPASRDSLGASSLPDGRAYYAYLVKSETTTSLTPDRIFELGQSEIARIHREMQHQMDAVGFHGDFKAFVATIKADPRFYVTSRQALLERASFLAKKIDGELPRLIGKLPRLTYGVREVPRAIEEGYTTGRYDPGSPALGISGGLMINTSHLDQRPLYELPSLVAHEGVPGHHIQIALAQEMSDLPGFRRDYATTAFVEGWALYSEQIVSEIGLYPTPYERFGQLSMEMWRACRLVMDVGIHWKNWSRDQALACLRENTALAEKNIQNETNRYISWPGQALGYKIGELTILDLRHQAEKALGTAFDERRFHDLVLDEGAMPLALLRQRVKDWIAAEKHHAP